MYSLEQIQEKVSKYHPEITVLELIKIKYIKCYCNKCGGEYVQNKYNAINSHSGCPYCAGIKVSENINSISAVCPDLVKYFIDKEFPKTHTISSNVKTKLKCPNCGYEKIATPLSMKGKFYCPQCSDGVSYPNKFLREVLKQLNVDNTIEYQPEWGKPYFYDNYFELNGQKYIIEIDGAYHYEGARNDAMFKKINSDTSKRDNIKNKLALEHNIILIRIDAQKSDPDYIKDKILTSEMSNLFDLSQIDWDLCNKNSLLSKVIEACNLLNEGFSINDIAKKLQVSSCTIRNYLKKGHKLNLCSYNNKEYALAYDSRVVYVFNDKKELILTAKNKVDCQKQLEERFKIHFTTESMSMAEKNEKMYNNLYYLTRKNIQQKSEKEKTSFQKDLERRII